MVVSVGLVQMDIEAGDKEVNLSYVDRVVGDISGECDFVCLPEYFSTGSVPDRFNELGESVPGPTVDRLIEIAVRDDVYLIGSLVESDGGELYNTGVVVGPDGLLSKYRKVHLFVDERDVVTPGVDKPPVVETEFGRIGLMVCYDAIFPELSRFLGEEEADLVFIPSNWPAPFIEAWRVATSARALDNQFWTVGVNRVGSVGEFSYFGKSRVTNPYGETITELNSSREIEIIKIDYIKKDEFKAIVDFKKDLNI
ncbi:carbon-nitrogen hydrolase family protein [Methanonatronarchaeum sp. AMET-Sl]|uniref:carbon-nitrogen hydrolase family protein n=1 Tax=Methanonatronarchaeum sp. AMET-Sl TaxID=3037654 RepID=UPI00244E5339|nr:carbon-nitrogen hydrolase family protein [Methanonatronarchaeum sp. AMET-Sl]WGI18099.1 carbon-nitrogen hydrolase family protein [Methanonatronarchaeum sp. AMET-Sl]